MTFSQNFWGMILGMCSPLGSELLQIEGLMAKSWLSVEIGNDVMDSLVVGIWTCLTD